MQTAFRCCVLVTCYDNKAENSILFCPLHSFSTDTHTNTSKGTSAQYQHEAFVGMHREDSEATFTPH